MVRKDTMRTGEENEKKVLEALPNSATIAGICRKYNVASSATHDGSVHDRDNTQSLYVAVKG